MCNERINIRNIFFQTTLLLCCGECFANEISTKSVNGNNTNITPLTSTINITATPSMVLNIASNKINVSGNQMSVSIKVNHSSPSVSSGISADQVFKDLETGDFYYGFYLSSGVQSANQSSSRILIKIKRGNAETPGRTYYRLGNETLIPTQKSDLKRANNVYETFATVPVNSIHCGPKYARNGITNDKIKCDFGTTLSQMDLTQFVKVQPTDKVGAQVVSQVEFIAVTE